MEALATCSISAAPKALADHLAAVKPAVASRHVVSALTGVRIVLSAEPGGRAYMEATDMHVAVRRDIYRCLHSCTIGGELDVILSHSDLSKAVKLFAKREVVSLVDGDGEVAVTDGKRTIKLRKLRAEDWPRFADDADHTDEPLFTAEDGTELAGVLLRAAAFASADETRPILTGVAFVSDDGYGRHAREGMRVWSTDSYRLADLALPAGRARQGDGQRAIVNVVGRGVVMAAKAMLKRTAKLHGPLREVHVSTRGLDHAIFRFHGEVWTVRVLDGQFPNFRQLVPDTAAVTVTMPVAELVGACEVAEAFARRNAPMALSVNGTIKVTGSTPDVADFEEVLSSATYIAEEPHTFDELVIGLNPEFAADIAKSHTGETVTLRLISALRPALFVDGDDLYLLMPIRLNI